MTNNTIVTIGRQFGSGGKEIGENLAKKLNVPFYDKQLIALASKKSGISEELLDNVDEKATNSLLYTLAISSSMYGRNTSGFYEIPLNDKLFIIQSDVIKSIADESSCVIVGRCADYILREYKNCLNIFIYSDISIRIERVSEIYNIAKDKATDLIMKTDKQRKSYYSYYSGQKWGNVENSHLSINSGKLGIENSTNLIKNFVELYS